MASKDQGITHVRGLTASSSDRASALALQQFGNTFNSNKVIRSSDSITNSFQNFRFANLKVKKDNSSFFENTTAVCGLRGNKNSKQSIPQNMKVRDIPPCVTAVGSQSNQASFICSEFFGDESIYSITFEVLNAVGAAGLKNDNIFTTFFSNELDTLIPINIKNVTTPIANPDHEAQLIISRLSTPSALENSFPNFGNAEPVIPPPLPDPFNTVLLRFTMIRKANAVGLYNATDTISIKGPGTGSTINLGSAPSQIGAKAVSILEGTYVYGDGTLGPFAVSKKGKKKKK